MVDPWDAHPSADETASLLASRCLLPELLVHRAGLIPVPHTPTYQRHER